MCAQFGGTVPCFRGVIPRTRLLEWSGRHSAAPCLIVAPSGYGKTVLAAQLARCFDDARWISCGGAPPDQAVLVTETARVLDVSLAIDDRPSSLADLPDMIAASSAGDEAPRCLVVDDAGWDEGGRLLDDLWLLAQVLSQGGCALVVTSQEHPGSVSRVLHRFDYIGPEELRFTREEALEYSTSVREHSLEAADIEAVWEQTQGHAAFFAVMLQAYAVGAHLGEGANPRLSAWIRHAVSTQVRPSDIPTLILVSLLGSGRSVDVNRDCVADAASSLDRLASVMPLVRLQEGTQSRSRLNRSFTVHDLLAEQVLGDLRARGETHDALVRRAIDILLARGDLGRAAAVADLSNPELLLEFLESNGFACVSAGESRRLAELLENAPLAHVMSHPRLLLLWADALLDCDEFEESLAKARAARVLADHEGDVTTGAQAIATALDALRLMNRWEDASSLLDVGLSLANTAAVPEDARAAILRAGATLRILSGEYPEARDLLEATMSVESDDQRFESDVREAAEALALLPCFAEGDMISTVRALSPWAALDTGRLSQRVDSRGNLSAALVEIGRTERAVALLTELLPIACVSSQVCFLPVLGCAEFAEGREQLGLETVSEGIRKALESGAEVEAAQNRVFEAMLLRAAGRTDDSLTSAERAYERLCVQDYMDFRRLAALEVAASLLALGDATAARAWAEPVVAAGFGDNAHHAFRGAMVLAECDRNGGDVEAGIRRLARHEQHVRSENSNFQAAMYSRAFPDLLSMIAAAVGSADVPIHMIRMIPPENAERTLRASRAYLDSAEWAILGSRLLGDDQFDAFVERKGRPICRVRMFGGLEVKVGDRPVRERDWKKRKARTVFAMLVLKRGQEISRDQLLDHVWPDLPEDRAKNNFYVAWSSMKGALMGAEGKAGPCPYIDGTAGRCRVVREAVRSDIDEFEELLAAGREGDTAGDGDKAITSYERLSAVYRGELLPGDLYDDWFAPLRDRYRFDFVAAMLRLVELYLERDDPCSALVFARRALGVDPTREDLYQATLRCQIAAGQRSAAVETFVQCKTQLAEELGLDPSAETVALYQQILVMEDVPRHDDYGVNG